MGSSHNKEIGQSRFVPIGEGFWNARASFKVMMVINIGTHMSVIKLKNEKFLIIDTIPLDDEAKLELDALTDNGNKIEAVVATHPFHSLSFPAFYEKYPNVPYYGTPRHLRNLKQIPWVGSIAEPENLNRWAPDVEMRIPAGAEFDNPQPESFNHFSCAWVYHRQSRTVHVDDTINYYAESGGLSQWVTDIFGKTGTFSFHPAIGLLYPTKEAPIQFRDWVKSILHDWDFDNVCAAHVGVRMGGSKQLLAECLEKAEPLLEKLSNNATVRECEHGGKKVGEMNVEGHECG